MISFTCKIMASILLLISIFQTNVLADSDVEKCEDLASHWKNNDARNFCIRAAKAGDASAKFYLYRIINNDNLSKPPNEKENQDAWLIESAEQKYPDALIELGDRLSVGETSGESDRSKAVIYYKAAYNILVTMAEAGDIKAQLRLSTMYLYGYGIEKNDEKATYWSNRAFNNNGGKLPLFRASAAALIARDYLINNASEKAKNLFDLAITIDPYVSTSIASMYAAEGNSFIDKDDLANAEKYFDIAISFDKSVASSIGDYYAKYVLSSKYSKINISAEKMESIVNRALKLGLSAKGGACK